ncbi:hypothetical protein GTY41_45645, partial [Streptomyces sp. SID685]|nr:hypothetical protein [Streptomyces sp. SID685]
PAQPPLRAETRQLPGLSRTGRSPLLLQTAPKTDHVGHGLSPHPVRPPGPPHHRHGPAPAAAAAAAPGCGGKPGRLPPRPPALRGPV